jgi:hypothetical protein
MEEMVRIDEFERREDKFYARYVSQVRDVSSDELFELTIAGPDELVREVLAEATIDITIDSAQSVDDLKRRFDELSAGQRKHMWSLAGLENVDELFKPEPASPRRETSVLVTARPVNGEGTPFVISVAGFTVPATVSVFFFGSWVFFANGVVLPSTGDQDLNLRLFSTTGPVVSRSAAGGTAPDFVWCTLPSPFGPLPFVPVFEVVGFTTGVCATFTATGA